MIAAQVKLFPVVPIAGDGTARFQPIAVEDVARCLVDALERDDVVGRTIEAGGPAFLSYEQIIDLVAETIGAKIAKVYVPLGLMRPVAAVMQALMPRPPVTPEQLKMLGVDNTTDLDSVEDHFAFMPRPARGNIGYVTRIGLADALKMNLGFMPVHIRDH
jgi:NADH dehydrogenase